MILSLYTFVITTEFVQIYIPYSLFLIITIKMQ